MLVIRLEPVSCLVTILLQIHTYQNEKMLNSIHDKMQLFLFLSRFLSSFPFTLAALPGSDFQCENSGSDIYQLILDLVFVLCCLFNILTFIIFFSCSFNFFVLVDAFVLLFWEQLVGVVWWMVRGGGGALQLLHPPAMTQPTNIKVLIS